MGQRGRCRLNEQITIFDYHPREKGHWINTEDNDHPMYECSECGCRMFKKEYDIAVGTRGYNFCPYCGADMRGAD